MNVKVHIVHSFAKTPYGGNPAGVVTDADGLAEKDMQLLAAKVGFSETAFVQKSTKASYKVRFFTPNNEVDLCGHATIAVFTILVGENLVFPGEYSEETKAGILKIECGNDRTVFMTQNTPQFYELLDKNEIAASLNISESLITAHLPVQAVSTGLKDIIVPVDSLETLFSIKPQFDMVAGISKRYDAVGYHVFTTETKFNSTAHCRNFAPLYAIPEESATGASNGALSCYLHKYGVIAEPQTQRMIFEQGYSMDKPSEISASLQIADEAVTEVKVGGTALIIGEKEFII